MKNATATANGHHKRGQSKTEDLRHGRRLRRHQNDPAPLAMRAGIVGQVMRVMKRVALWACDQIIQRW